MGSIPTGSTTLLPSSNGQDSRFSLWKHGFDSRWEYHFRRVVQRENTALTRRLSGVRFPPRLPFASMGGSSVGKSSRLISCRSWVQAPPTLPIIISRSPLAVISWGAAEREIFGVSERHSETLLPGGSDVRPNTAMGGDWPTRLGNPKGLILRTWRNWQTRRT